MAAPREVAVDVANNSLHLLHLPSEITEFILLTNSINHTDLGRIAAVCTKLRNICKSNELWKRKLTQRWPHLLDRYVRGLTYNWNMEYQNRHLFGRKIRKMVEELSPTYYSHEEISKEGFGEFGELLGQHDHAGEFLVDELMEIVHDGNSKKNLTIKYYAEKVLRYLQQQHLAQKIIAFLELPALKQKLEIGAAMIAQWCQPTENITENDISDQLDVLANTVKDALRERNGEHPVFKKDTIQDVEEDQWSPDQCRAVLESLNQVLFTQRKFCGNKKNYYTQTNSYIDKVLKNRTGIPITLCIVYSAIARRLGVICEPVNFPSHFLLSWKEHPMCSSVEQKYTFIDVFNGGKFITYKDLSDELNIPSSMISLETVRAAQPNQVFERIARNLVGIGRQQGTMGDSLLCLRNALELFLIICPDDLDMRLLQVRVNLHLNINLADVIDSLQRIADHDQNRMGLVAYLMNHAQTQMEENKTSNAKKKVQPKLRKNNKTVTFSVGTIMNHKRYHYRCVAYGWDSTCQATQEWIIQMGVNNLPQEDKQPFYNVLVEDGSNRYAAQENLEMTDTNEPITHPEVGRYFQEHCGRYYLPNEEKRTEYPDDIEETRRLVQEHKNGDNQ